MSTPLNQKSTIDEIRQRFDNDVERFSCLETGQAATVDAPLAMELITEAATKATSPIGRVLDIGCGAGNNTLRLRQQLDHDIDADLLDLSQPMLDRAATRLAQVNTGSVRTICDDFRVATTPKLPTPRIVAKKFARRALLRILACRLRLACA